ncbi:MAG: hypothetical protein K0Q70_1180 [Rhodospirillales bacterium]|nr:hypothetical protein [Rhodospirillales bacterium]
MADLIRRLGEVAGLEDALRHSVEPAGPRADYLPIIEDALRDLWNLGRNLVLVWCEPRDKTKSGIEVLVVPHYAIAAAQESSDEVAKTIERLLGGPKKVSAAQLRAYETVLGDYTPAPIPLPPGTKIDDAEVSELVKRFGITYVEDRAVALFDIVGFSLYSPLEQVTQLNSLSYSVNSAHSKMLSKKIDITFARSTTGDGFYVWNRDRSIQANINLYHFMHLVLADNAIARGKSRGNVTPLLRAAFHIGGHYEYYQSEGLSPTIYSYIVGDVTIELARLIDRAVAGQVILGDFRVPMPDEQTQKSIRVDAESFIERTQQTLSSLEGLVLSGEPVDAIKCYLTGSKGTDGRYSITKYLVTDKHGLTRYAYNAKINIYRENAEPIFLGVQDHDLKLQATVPVAAAPKAKAKA